MSANENGLMSTPMAPIGIRADFRFDTHRLTADIFRPRSTTASAMPACAYSSSVRACTARAREVVPGSVVLSTIRTRTPIRVSQSARTNPVGPAPAIRTSGSLFSAIP
jgi:hypothetical protein